MPAAQTQLKRRHSQTRNTDEPVSILWSRQVKSGREADFETWAHGITAEARKAANTTSSTPSSTAPASMRGSTPTSGQAGWPMWAS